MGRAVIDVGGVVWIDESVGRVFGRRIDYCKGVTGGKGRPGKEESGWGEGVERGDYTVGCDWCRHCDDGSVGRINKWNLEDSRGTT